MIGIVGDQLSKAVRIRSIVSRNTRPDHHTTNTTQGQRDREKLQTEDQSKEDFASRLVKIKTPPRLYTDQLRHLQDSIPKSTKNLSVFSDQLSTLMPNGMPISVYLKLSQMQSGRYDADALDIVMDNAGLDIDSLPLQGSSDTGEDPVKVYPPALIARSSSLQLLCIR